MQPTLILLILILAGAFGGAAYAVLGNRQRRLVMDRTSAFPSAASAVLTGKKRSNVLVAGVQKITPVSWTKSSKVRDKLIQAGYDSETAPLTFAAVRIASLVLAPVLVFALAPRFALNSPHLALPAGLYAGFIVPLALLDRKRRERQDKIKKAMPDALDLLIVCVESGSSLDSSLLRVAREMRISAPELSEELLVVNRKTNAGMPREEALRGLATRTGLSELRALVSAMIQSEKWGTSIAQVLRVNAENFRRKRRQSAERRAQQAPVKMIFPLVFFILPALFLVILGPAGIQIAKIFGGEPTQ